MDTPLKEKIVSDSQWPFGKRKVQYQTIEDLPGIRDMAHRYEIMRFPESFEGKSILDIGCNLGVVCIDAHNRGAEKAVGIDYREETISVAKQYADSQGLPIEYHVFNVNAGLEALQKLIGPEPFDYVFALSILNHVKRKHLWDIINHYCSDICWFEGHANQKPEDLEILFRNLKFERLEHVGNTTDRSKRANFKLYAKV